MSEDALERLDRLEKRVGSLEDTLNKIEATYEQVRKDWPQVRQALLNTNLPEAEALVQRVEELDSQVRKAVQEAKTEARRVAETETRSLKDRLAELLGKVSAMDQVVQVVGQYAQQRRSGDTPKEALLGVVDAKLQALETKLEQRVQNTSRSDIATALTYVGVPSLAATIISFFLAGAFRRKGDDAIQILFQLLHSKLNPDQDNTRKK